MFTNTRLLQYNNVSPFCVYIFDNFLDKEYQNIILQKTIELTKEDSLNHVTNVKANMTKTSELLKHEEYNFLKGRIATFLNLCFTLRTAHWSEKRNINFLNMWGMQHFKNHYTKNHTHGEVDWSGAYYLRCPDETNIYFPDVEDRDVITENSLYLFPGGFQHYTDRHVSDTSRVSIAFNCNISWTTGAGF